MIQNDFKVRVVKTQKVEVDDDAHLLPPDNGSYSEYKVADYFCPDEWSKDGIFIPVNEGDPLWFDFRGNDECAILCAVQRINPVTGEPADLEGGLSKDPTQNYLRMPEQLWLDGYARDGKVYQFVVTKAGIGLAVNEYVLPKHMQDSHAIGFAFFGPKNPKPKVLTRHIHHYSSPYVCYAPQQVKYGSLRSSKAVWKHADQPVSGLSDEVEENCLGSITCCDTSGHVSDVVSNDIGTQAMNFSDSSSVFEGIEDGELPYAADEQVETVNILAEQEQDLTELDKASMGAGGRIKQRIVTDDNTTDYYHAERSALLTIYFALPEMFDAIMKKGTRQDASRKDKYKTSGQIGSIPVPLITGNE